MTREPTRRQATVPPGLEGSGAVFDRATRITRTLFGQVHAQVTLSVEGGYWRSRSSEAPPITRATGVQAVIERVLRAQVAERQVIGSWQALLDYCTVAMGHAKTEQFRLLFLEKREIDCLLLHEVCHLKHLNHGKRFWGLMEKHMAGAKERDKRLGEGWKLVPPWALVK